MKRKSIIALMLTFIMVFAMSITSFASTGSNVSVSVSIVKDGVSIVSRNVDVPINGSLYSTSETNIENYNVVGTAYDALYSAATITSSKVQYLETSNWTPINRWGLTIDSVNGISGTTSDIIISEDEDGNKTHQVTYGYWSLYINGNYADEYATAYMVTGSNPVTSVSLVWSEYTYTYIA